MFLKRLSIVNYKSYERGTFTFEKRINCFTGRNGSGKTNLLDSIYYLCLTKSYFSTNEQQNIRHGESFFTLVGELSAKDELLTITCKIGRHRKKEFLKCEIPYDKLADHIGSFPVVFIAPNDVSMIYGGSEERRKFIDGLIAQIDPVYLSNLQRYNKLLAQRNALLKRFGETNTFDGALLQVYSDKMLEPGTYIFKRRSEVINEFVPVFRDIYRVISGGREVVSVLYESEVDKIPLNTLFGSHTDRDRMARRTTSGIHRDDLIFMMDEHVIKKFGSQGQQKSFLISVKLTQYQLIRNHKDITPFLLLDDIFDKLDEERSANLLTFITSEQFGQIFITDTRKERIERIFGNKLKRIQIFEMETVKN